MNESEDLVGRIETLARRQEQTHNLAQIGFEAGVLVHDLSNILGGMLGHVQLAELTGAEEDVKKCTQVLGTGLQRARELITRFKTQSGKVRAVNLVDVKAELEDLLRMLAPELARETIGYTLAAEEGYLLCDRDRLRRVVLESLVGVASALPPMSLVNVSFAKHGAEWTLRMIGAPGTGGRQTGGSSLFRPEELQMLATSSMEMNSSFDELFESEGTVGVQMNLPAV